MNDPKTFHHKSLERSTLPDTLLDKEGKIPENHFTSSREATLPASEKTGLKTDLQTRWPQNMDFFVSRGVLPKKAPQAL